MYPRFSQTGNKMGKHFINMLCPVVPEALIWIPSVLYLLLPNWPPLLSEGVYSPCAVSQLNWAPFPHQLPTWSEVTIFSQLLGHELTANIANSCTGQGNLPKVSSLRALVSSFGNICLLSGSTFKFWKKFSNYPFNLAKSAVSIQKI